MKYQPHPKNAPGPFYVVHGHCIACEAPVAEAPDLMAFDASHCYFKKQPATPDEVERSLSAICVSCVRAVRYSGDDPEILKRLCESGNRDACDVLEPVATESRRKKWWQFWRT